MRNPIDDTRPQVILPMKYLDEVRTAPQNRLSFPYFSEQVSCNSLTNCTIVEMLCLGQERGTENLTRSVGISPQAYRRPSSDG